jgi:hypothetical protein
MKVLKVVKNFTDKITGKYNEIGATIEADEKRAEDFLKAGVCELVKEVKEKVQEVETAVKEEQKEKGIKKVFKKNAKK